MMRLSLLLAALFILPFTLFGCAATPQAMDYNALPGSDHMAKGPGLFSRDQKGAYDGGYTIYSTRAPGEKVISPTTTRTPTEHSRRESPRAQSDAHRHYQAFEAWQRFKRLPEDAPERRAFQQWQKWQRFRHWQKQHR